VRDTAQMLDARINLGVVVETQNAEPRQVKGLASTGGATAPCENSLAGDFMRCGPSPSGGALFDVRRRGLFRISSLQCTYIPSDHLVRDVTNIVHGLRFLQGWNFGRRLGRHRGVFANCSFNAPGLHVLSDVSGNRALWLVRRVRQSRFVARA
jgi:hypothetical protein